MGFDNIRIGKHCKCYLGLVVVQVYADTTQRVICQETTEIMMFV